QHKLQELTDLCTRLQRQQDEMALKITTHDLDIFYLKDKIKSLKDKDGGGAEPSREDVTIKGRSLETGEEAGVEKSREKIVESDMPKKKKIQEQIDVQVAREIEEQLAREDQRRDEQIGRDAEIAKIRAEEELQMLIDGLDRNNKTIVKYLQKYE
nr:hypothetical protein [Tanacetum cinerariifolium]